VTKTCDSSRGFQRYERDYSRGAQIVLQSRTANRLSGWIGYTLTYARQNSVYSHNPFYPTLDDQRHTLNVFASYRISPPCTLVGSGCLGPDFRFQATTMRFERVTTSASTYALRRIGPSLVGSLLCTVEVLNLTNHNNPGISTLHKIRMGHSTS